MTTVPKSFRVWKSDDNLPQNDPNRRSDAAAAWRGVSTARSSLLRFLCVHACVLLNPSQNKKQQQTKQNTIWREHSFMILRIFLPTIPLRMNFSQGTNGVTELILFSWEDCAVFFNAKPHHCWFSTHAVQHVYWPVNYYLFELYIVMRL